MPSNMMETVSGRNVDALALQAEDVVLDDIFTALSRQCRFNGHAPVCVAQHSLGVRKLLEMRGESPIVQLRGLAHDFAEAYIPDLISPHKRRPEFASFEPIEERVLESIWRILGLGDVMVDYAPVINLADRDMGILEGITFLPSQGKVWGMYDEVLWKSVADESLEALKPYLTEIHWSWWRGMMRNTYTELQGKIEERKS